MANSNDGSGVLEELNKPHLKRKLKILCEASLAERGWSLDVAKKRLGVPFLSFLLDDSAPFVLSRSFVEKLIQQLLFRVVRWDGSIPIIDPSQSYLSAEELLDSLSNGVHS